MKEQRKMTDPIPLIADDIYKETRILCLDEFQVYLVVLIAERTGYAYCSCHVVAKIGYRALCSWFSNVNHVESTP